MRRSTAVTLDHRDPGVVIARVSREIDTATAPMLSAALHRLLDTRTCHRLVVDLRAVEALGLVGIGTGSGSSIPTAAWWVNRVMWMEEREAH